MLQIRKLVGEEGEEADLIWLQAFERGNRSVLDSLREYRAKYAHRIVRFGLWNEQGLQATFEMVNIHLDFGPEVILPTGYISSIACLPTSRGKSYGGAGLAHMLGHMRDSGQVLTTLAPGSFDYYRQFGWEWINVRRAYQVPSRILKHDSESDHVRVAVDADRPAVAKTYKHFCKGYRGMAARDDDDWERLLNPSSSHFTYTFIYERDDVIEGYLVLREGNSEETQLPEFITVTPRARRGLLGLLSRHKMQSKLFSWYAPCNDGLWSHILDRDLRTWLEPCHQGRVVDVPGALGALRPVSSQSMTFTLGIRDSCAPWNTGTWQVTAEGGVVALSPTGSEPQVSIDIGAFSQAYFGVLTVPELRAEDRLSVNDEAAFQTLSELLNGPPMWEN